MYICTVHSHIINWPRIVCSSLVLLLAQHKILSEKMYLTRLLPLRLSKVPEMPPKARKRKALEAVPTNSENKSSDTPSEPTHWLIKSEPETRIENGVDMRFSFDDLKEEPDSTAHWDGVRNYSARNNMRSMKVGQQAFFYHSNTKPPGIIGIVDIVKEAYVDHTQFDPKDPHYDGGSKKVTCCLAIPSCALTSQYHCRTTPSGPWWM